MTHPKLNIFDYLKMKAIRAKAILSITPSGIYYILGNVVYPEEVFDKKYPLKLKKLKLKGESPDSRTNYLS